MNLQLRIPPLVTSVFCAGAMLGLHRTVPLAHPVPQPYNQVGWLVVGLGGAIIATAVLQFRSARTTVDPTKPAKASALVRSGIFGYSRNPMYLGMATMLCGVALLLGSVSPWVILPLFVFLLTRLQIQPEEAALAKLFGEAFTEYCAQVGRWFGRRR